MRQVELPGVGAAARALPKAARLQTITSDLDELLTRAARARHPTVAWWWGTRQTDKGFGAVCYVCDVLVVSWSRKWPMTQAARRVVMRHRTRHTRALRALRDSELPAGRAGGGKEDQHVGD